MKTAGDLSMFDLSDAFELYEAIHCYATLNHSGQSSELYSVLSRSPFRPGMLWTETRCLEENNYVNLLDDKTCIELFKILESKT